MSYSGISDQLFTRNKADKTSVFSAFILSKLQIIIYMLKYDQSIIADNNKWVSMYRNERGGKDVNFLMVCGYER